MRKVSAIIYVFAFHDMYLYLRLAILFARIRFIALKLLIFDLLLTSLA